MKYRIEEIHRKNGNIQFCPQYKRWLFWHYFYDKYNDNFLVKKTREEAESFLARLVEIRKEEAEQRKKYLENLERELEGETVVGRKGPRMAFLVSKNKYGFYPQEWKRFFWWQKLWMWWWMKTHSACGLCWFLEDRAKVWLGCWKDGVEYKCKCQKKDWKNDHYCFCEKTKDGTIRHGWSGKVKREIRG